MNMDGSRDVYKSKLHFAQLIKLQIKSKRFPAFCTKFFHYLGCLATFNELFITGVTGTRVNRTSSKARKGSVEGRQERGNGKTSPDPAAQQPKNEDVHYATCQTELSAPSQTTTAVRTHIGLARL